MTELLCSRRSPVPLHHRQKDLCCDLKARNEQTEHTYDKKL